jgi:putative transposase
MSQRTRRFALVDRGHGELSVRRQRQLLGIARSGIYRLRPAANDDDDPALLRRIDELFTAWPFLGFRRMTAMLRTEGHAVNRKRTQRLMRDTGIAAFEPKPRSTKPTPGHKIFLICCGLAIQQPNQVSNQVGCADIMDWASRAVLAWRLSNMMDAQARG